MRIDAEIFKKRPDKYIWEHGDDYIRGHSMTAIAVSVYGNVLLVGKEVCQDSRGTFNEINLGAIKLVSGSDELTVDAEILHGLKELIKKMYREQDYRVTFVGPQNVPFTLKRSGEALS